MKKLALVSLLTLSPIFAHAVAPQIEFYLTQYDGKNCLERAGTALKASGFRLKSGTYVSEDRVGVYGEYKGAVGCSSEVENSVVFVVSGPDYGTASDLARAMQRNF